MIKKLMHFAAEPMGGGEYQLELAYLVTGESGVDLCKIDVVGTVKEDNLLETWKSVKKAVEIVNGTEINLIIH